MWTDYYLKFASENDYNQYMPENLKATASESHATDVIGVLTRMDTFEELDGFHVNLRLRNSPLPVALGDFDVGTPEHPKRVFA